MNDKNIKHMNSKDFRKYGYDLIDWIADYYDSVDTFDVHSKVKPGEIRNNLPDEAPEEGESMEQILNDFNTIIMPGITHWQSPKFFGYFPANTSGPSILGDLLSSGLGVNGMLWETSPACTELETHVLDWLALMLKLPEQFLSKNTGGGVIQDTASSASLCAMMAARERKSKGESNLYGLKNQMIVYVSSQTHCSIERAAMVLGIGSQNIRVIKINDDFSMNEDALEYQIKADKKNGLLPFFLCATIGTTSSNAIDHIGQIGKICYKYNIWMHVDAAMAGTVAICPEYRYLQKDLIYANSYLFNPHKWMLTNFDCSCLFLKNRKNLIDALSIHPEYLKNNFSSNDEVIDYRDWQIPLGRRFRSLKLWAVLRYYGKKGLKEYIRNHIRLTQDLFQKIKDHKDFEISAPAPFNLICFRAVGSNQLNKRLHEAINNSGEIFISHTKLNGQFVLRICVGQTHTERRHVDFAWEIIKKNLSLIK